MHVSHRNAMHWWRFEEWCDFTSKFIFTSISRAKVCLSQMSRAICYENKILFLFQQYPTGNYGRLSRLVRHTSLSVAACLVRISSEVGHSHPWPRQGHCMPKTSVTICVYRLNIQKDMAKKRTYKAWTN